MMYPVDQLTTVASGLLEESAKDYMSKLCCRNPEMHEYFSIPGSEKIKIDLSNVVFFPLYGSKNEEKILAVLSPQPLKGPVGFYLLNKWWSSEDILKTADSSRTGLMEVRTLGERVVLYVLNRIIYRTKEEAEDDVAFICHGEDEIAKILWENGEAIGFYSVKPEGRVGDGFLTTCYQHTVMDTIFIRKCHRRNGHGFQMLKDFVASFKPGSMGLKYPLSPAMKKVCEKYLSCYPEDSKLLLEIQGVGSPFQRTPIAKKLHEIDLKGNHQVVRKLNFDTEDNNKQVEFRITEELEIVEYKKVVNEVMQIKIKEVKDTTIISRQNIKPVVQNAEDDSVHEHDKLPLNLQKLELKNTMETVTHDVTATSEITPFCCEEQTKLTPEPTCQSEKEQMVKMAPVMKIQSLKSNEDEKNMTTSEATTAPVPRQPKKPQHMEEMEIVKMPSETENARERAGEVNEIEDDLEMEMLPVGRETFEEVKKTKPDRDTPDEEINNTDIIVSSEDDEIELSEETNFVTPLRCSSRLKHQAVGIEITNSVHKSSTKASKAARRQEVKTKQALEDSEIDQVKEVVETTNKCLNNEVEDEGNADKEHSEKTITDNRNIIEMENKSQPEIKANHAEIEVEEQEKEPVSAKALQTSEETNEEAANKEAQEHSVSQKDVDLELHLSEITQHRNKGKEFEVEPSEKEQDIVRKHGKAVEIIKERAEITKTVKPAFIKHLKTRTAMVTPKKRPKHVTGTQAAKPETEAKVGHEIVTVQSAEEVKTAVEEMHETNPECDVEEVLAVSESVGRDQLKDTNVSENDAEEAPDGGRDLVEKTVDDKVVETTDREIVVEGNLHMRTMEKEERDELNQENIRSADSEQKIALEDETLFEKSFEEEPSKREKEKQREEEKDVNISISEEVLDQSEEDVGVDKRVLRKRTITIKDASRRKSKRLRQHGQGENDSPVRAKEMEMTDVKSPAKNTTTHQGKGQEIVDTNAVGGEMSQKDKDQHKVAGGKIHGNENNSHEITVTKDVQAQGNEFVNVSEDDLAVAEEEERDEEQITEKIMEPENNTVTFDHVDDEAQEFEDTQEEPEQSKKNAEKITEASVTVSENFTLELDEEIDDDDNTDCNKVVEKIKDSFGIMTNPIIRGRKSKSASPEQSSAMRSRRVLQDSQSEMEDQAEKIEEMIGEEEKSPQQKRKSIDELKPRRSKRLARAEIV